MLSLSPQSPSHDTLLESRTATPLASSLSKACLKRMKFNLMPPLLHRVAPMESLSSLHNHYFNHPHTNPGCTTESFKAGPDLLYSPGELIESISSMVTAACCCQQV